MAIAIRRAFLREFFGKEPAAVTEVSIHKEIQNFFALVFVSISTRIAVLLFPKSWDEKWLRKRPKLEYAENQAGVQTSRKRLFDLLRDRESLRFVATLTTISVPITTRLIRNAVFGDNDIEKVTEDYGVLNFDAIYTDERVVDMLLNGYCPVRLQAHEKKKKSYVWEGAFDQYEFGHQIRFPNVRIVLERQNPRSMVLQEIELTERGQPTQRYTPSSADWLQAKRVAWGVVQYDGILRFHSGLCHMLIEQYMVAVDRHFSWANPLRSLLRPYLKHVRGTNYLADHLVWGDHQLTVAFGPFTHRSSGQFIRDYLGEIDWKKWQPVAALGEFHRYAHASELFLAVLDDYLDEFMTRNGAAVLTFRTELEKASRDLQRHSLVNAAGNPSASPLLQPGDSDAQVLENARVFCRFLIFQVCFAHCWSHLALANGYPLNPFAEHYDYQNIKRAGKGMQIAQATHFAHRKRGGLPKLMDQYDGEIEPQFLSRLEAQRCAFAGQGLDIDYLLESLV